MMILLLTGLHCIAKFAAKIIIFLETETEEGNKKRGSLEPLLFWVGDGIRTHDPRNHNPVL